MQERRGLYWHSYSRSRELSGLIPVEERVGLLVARQPKRDELPRALRQHISGVEKRRYGRFVRSKLATVHTNGADHGSLLTRLVAAPEAPGNLKHRSNARARAVLKVSSPTSHPKTWAGAGFGHPSTWVR